MRWFQSYLKERKQRCQWTSSISKWESVKCGVPQGLVLGPLLFIVYMDDLLKLSTSLAIQCRADDTTVYVAEKEVEEVVETLNADLNVVSIWMKKNLLMINLKKSVVFFLKGKRRQIESNILDVVLDYTELDVVQPVKILRVIVDSSLTFAEDIGKVQKSAAAGMKML